MPDHFQALFETHEQLRRLLQVHQETLVEGARDRARGTFDRYAHALRAHLTAEDELLFPRYHEVAPPTTGGGIELFEAEHRKVSAFLRRMEDALAACNADPIPPAQRIEWLEEQARFKHLLDHHHQREETVLAPALVEHLAPEELEERAAAFLARQVEAGLWEALRD